METRTEVNGATELPDRDRPEEEVPDAVVRVVGAEVLTDREEGIVEELLPLAVPWGVPMRM